MDINKIMVIAFSSIFINNFVFSRFLGFCPCLGSSRKLNSAVGFGLTATVVMVLSTLAVHPIYLYILVPYRLDKFLQIIIYLLFIAGLVWLLDFLLKKAFPGIYHIIGMNLPVLMTNCAILGTALIAAADNYNLAESLVFSFASGIGLTLALIMMASVRDRLVMTKVPKAYQDLPIAFITAALLSLVMNGFIGFIK
jgi:Na+-translocating ferredoxin:NAD+ oxidoreductase subunit A